MFYFGFILLLFITFLCLKGLVELLKKKRKNSSLLTVQVIFGLRIPTVSR